MYRYADLDALIELWGVTFVLDLAHGSDREPTSNLGSPRPDDPARGPQPIVRRTFDAISHPVRRPTRTAVPRGRLILQGADSRTVWREKALRMRKLLDRGEFLASPRVKLGLGTPRSF